MNLFHYDVLFDLCIKAGLQNCVQSGTKFTVFMSGQTGSGKTHLIFGVKENKIKLYETMGAFDFINKVSCNTMIIKI